VARSTLWSRELFMIMASKYDREEQ
jgi:hypothetical protein